METEPIMEAFTEARIKINKTTTIYKLTLPRSCLISQMRNKGKQYCRKAHT